MFCFSTTPEHFDAGVLDIQLTAARMRSYGWFLRIAACFRAASRTGPRSRVNSDVALVLSSWLLYIGTHKIIPMRICRCAWWWQLSEQQQEVILFVMVEYALGLMAHISVTTDAGVTELCMATERLFWKIYLPEGHLYWSNLIRICIIY